MPPKKANARLIPAGASPAIKVMKGPLNEPKAGLKIRAPKTICEGRSLSWDDYQIGKFNRDIQFNSSSTITQSEVSSTSTPHNEVKEKSPNSVIKHLRNLLKERQDKVYHKCGCEACDGCLNCPIWCQKNVTFDRNETGPPLIQSSQTEKSMKRKFNNRVLLYGPHIPRPLPSLNQTSLEPQIQKALAKICAPPNDFQSYMWPAIQRGLNVIMVAPPHSGKTLSYVPVFCSFILEKEASSEHGPVAVILCPTVEKCQQVYQLAKKFSPSVQVLQSSENCEILITTAPKLEECLKSSQVKLKRLSHVSIEDAHLVMRNDSSSLSFVFKVMDQIQIRRPQSSIQIVVSSEKWSGDLDVILKQLKVAPLLCFADFFEAAIYSGIQFKKKKLDSKYKIFYLNDVVKGNYATHKTVVFVGEADVSEIVEYFRVGGIEHILLTGNLEEISDNEENWNCLQSGQFKVLVCTDSAFDAAVKILDADWLVHYHLPPDWSQFKKRFRCLAAHLHSPGQISDPSRCSFMVLDEHCDSFFSELVESYALSSVTHLRL